MHLDDLKIKKPKLSFPDLFASHPAKRRAMLLIPNCTHFHDPDQLIPPENVDAFIQLLSDC